MKKCPKPTSGEWRVSTRRKGKFNDEVITHKSHKVVL